jgi:uncharacterized protein
MTMRRLAPALLLALITASGPAACSPQAGDSAAPVTPPATAPAAERQRHPVSGLDIIPLTVSSAAGRHRFRVEVAASPEDQARGLMFRTALGADEGMLFPRDPPREASFWMKNTVIPLDIIFIGTDGRILNIAANTVPYSEEPVTSAGITGAVLELTGGRAAQLGIKPGDRVEWQGAGVW